MLRFLISQLLICYGEPQSALETCAEKYFYNTCCRTNRTLIYYDGIPQPTVEDLLKTLHGILEEIKETVLVIDALDECIDQDELLEILDTIFSWDINGLRIFISSRATPGISGLLDSRATASVEAKSEIVDGDIKTFIQEQVVKHPKLRKWPISLRNKIQNTLTNGAGGMLRWVDCQLSILGKCVTIRGVKKAPKTLPKTLSETYSLTLLSTDECYWDYAILILLLFAI